MAIIERSLLFLAIVEPLTVVQLAGFSLPDQVTSLASLTTSLPGDPNAAQTSVSEGAASTTLPALSFGSLTTLVTSIGVTNSQKPSGEIGGTVAVGVSVAVDASVGASTSYDTGTRYLLPSTAATVSIASSESNSVTRYIRLGSSLPTTQQSVTYLESSPWVFPDSTTSAGISSVTNLETFPWIFPDSSTTDAVSVTNLETFSTFVPDSVVSTTTQVLTPLTGLVSTFPVTVATQTVSIDYMPSATVTDLGVSSSIIPDAVPSLLASSSRLSASSRRAKSSHRSAGTISPVAVALSTASGSARFSAPGQNLSMSTGGASTISVAALTPVGLRPTAAFSAVGPSGSAHCRYDAPKCPACNGVSVIDGKGSSFQIYCDAMVLTSKNYMRTGNSSAADCIAACNDFPGCGAASMSKTNHCLLAVGSSYYLSAQKGEVGFLKLLHGSRVSSAAVSASRTSSRTRSTTTRALASQPPNLAGCTLTDLNCPRCNLVDITDSNGQVFRILCNAYLISTEMNDFNTTHLDDCLTSCNDGSCIGVSYNNGLCHVSKSRLIGSVDTDGSFAFIPLRDSIAVTSSQTLGSEGLSATTAITQATGISPVASPLLTPSAFPTGAFTIETWRTNPTASYTLSATASCNTSLESICDTCTDLVDPNGQLYRVSCNWNWECSAATPMNTTSLKECMMACDEAPECQGGLFPDRETRECYLCPEFTIHPEAQHDGPPTVMFYRPASRGAASAVASMTDVPGVGSSADMTISSASLLGNTPLSLTTITDRASWSRITTTSSQSASTSIAASVVSCPAANGREYAFGSNEEPFTIFCDVAFYAQPYTVYQVSSFLDCARGCSEGCRAFEYVNDVCQLFDGWYDVVPAQGAIVGLTSDLSTGTPGTEIFTVPGPVVASLSAVSKVASTASFSVGY